MLVEHFANAPTAPFSSVLDSGENAVGAMKNQGMEGERERERERESEKGEKAGRGGGT